MLTHNIHIHIHTRTSPHIISAMTRFAAQNENMYAIVRLCVCVSYTDISLCLQVASNVQAFHFRRRKIRVTILINGEKKKEKK